MKVDEVRDYLGEVYSPNNARLSNAESLMKEGSILLLGPPGIGKTTATKESAQKMASDSEREFVDYEDSEFEKVKANPERYFLYVDLNLNDCEPSDLTGIPKENESGIMYRPFLWALCLSFPKIAGILCLDEFTNIQRLDVITASYKIALDHRVGFTKFSNKVMVVATGNKPEESTVANLLPSPLIDRFTIYQVEKPKIEKWADWMDNHFGNDWDKRTFGYLMHFYEDFLKIPSEPETLDNFPSPRSWTRIALLILKLSEARWKETILGTLGPEVGQKYFAFLKTPIPEVEELLKDPEKFRKLDLDGKYLASVLIGVDLKQRFEKNENEEHRTQELKKTLPILHLMTSEQQDFLILAILSTGKLKQDIALVLQKKDKQIKEILQKVADLRTKIEM